MADGYWELVVNVRLQGCSFLPETRRHVTDLAVCELVANGPGEAASGPSEPHLQHLSFDPTGSKE